MPRSITVKTLGDLVEHGYRLTCWCNTCLAIRPDADLDWLIEKLGGDFVFVDPKGNRLSEHWPCPACNKPMELRLSPPTKPRMEK